MKSTRPDLCIAFLPNTFTPTLIARVGLNVPVVASIHNVPKEDFESPERWDPNPIDRILRSLLVKRARGITVLLDEFRSYFPPRLQKQIFVLGNMVDAVADRASPGVDDPDGNTILSVGRLAKVKDHESLIRAFATLSEKFPNWNVKIFGTGPLKRDLGALISSLNVQKQVRLMGTTEAIAEEYRKAKIFCIPSYFEGFGLVTAEALAAGLPVIGFADCPGTNSLVKHSITGVLAEPTDRVVALTAALESLMSDASKRAEYGAAGPASVAHLTRTNIGEGWVSMIDQLIGQCRPMSSVRIGGLPSQLRTTL
jgi:glycosyltransferase involved in cell wall biosynthesis